MQRNLLLIWSVWSGPAVATEPAGSLDLYYVPDAKLKVAVPGDKITSDGGHATGVAGRGFVAPGVFVAGEIQTTHYDGFGGDGEDEVFDWMRVGVGLATPAGIYLLGQVVQLGNDHGPYDVGYGAQVGYSTSSRNSWELRAQVGYLDIADFGDGVELLAGGAVQIMGPLRLFAEYRVTTLELEDGDKLQFFEPHAGIRLRF